MKLTQGQELKRVAIEPLRRADLKAYADASGDQNPIHLDDDFAKSVGLPSVIVHGMFSMSLLGNFLLSIIGANYSVSKFTTRFRKITEPDQLLYFAGNVREVSDRLALCTLWIENAEGEKLTEGEAELIPSQTAY